MAVETQAPGSALVPFKQVREILEAFPRERFHLLLPTTYIGSSPLFIPAPTVVYINPDDERDVYKTPGSRADDLSPHATALQRIANAGGLDFDPSLTQHRHDRKNEPLICEQIAAGWYIDSLGQRRLISSGWTTQDLREGSQRARLLGRAADVARQFICEQCATRAMSRAIRKAMGLHGSYKRSEFFYLEDGKQKPKGFVAIRFRLDESDPDVKKAIIARHHGAIAEVFGPAQLEAPPAQRQPDALEDVEGSFTEDAEPAIPDEPKPKEKVDVGAVIDVFRKAAAAHPQANEQASAEDLGGLAYTLRDVWQLPTDKEVLAIARRSFARTVFGVGSAKLTTGQVRVVSDASRELIGQAQLAELRAFLAEQDPEFARAVGGAK